MVGNPGACPVVQGSREGRLENRPQPVPEDGGSGWHSERFYELKISNPYSVPSPVVGTVCSRQSLPHNPYSPMA